MTERGKMTITFNKKFEMPDFIDVNADIDSDVDAEVDAVVSADADARLLEDIAIEDFIRMKVIDDEEDEYLDKSIQSFTAVKEDDLKLVLTLIFNTPENVSHEMFDPDFLEFEFLKPELILDAEN